MLEGVNSDPPVVVLCVDDYMQFFFTLWCKAFSLTGSSLKVVVIPFSDNYHCVSDICHQFGHTLLDVQADEWRSLGRSIYGDESYRPGLSRYKYFSKLAALSLFNSDVIFYDVNAIPFPPPELFIDAFRSSKKDILFRWQLSSLGQNIPTRDVYFQLNRDNPCVGKGWSANFFISRPGAINIESAKEMVRNDSGLRLKFGTAPEQSFLTYYIAKFKLDVGSVSNYIKKSRGVSCRSAIWLDDLDGRSTLFSDDGCGANIKVDFVKWNGRAMHRAVDNYWIVDYINKSWLGICKTEL
jgi:hypothetical protein